MAKPPTAGGGRHSRTALSSPRRRREPPSVAGELTNGAMNSRSRDANLAKLESLRLECRFLPVDEAVLVEYGRVRLVLESCGSSQVVA